METVRINACIPYLLMVTRFFSESMFTPSHHPPEQRPGHTAPSDRETTGPQAPDEENSNAALNGNTLTISGRFKQPEIVLFADPTEKHSRVLVLKVNQWNSDIHTNNTICSRSGPSSQVELETGLMLKFRNSELESLTYYGLISEFLSLSSKPWLKLHLDSKPWDYYFRIF